MPTPEHDGLERKFRHLDRHLDYDAEAMMQSAPVEQHGASDAVCFLGIRHVHQNARGEAHVPLTTEFFRLKDETEPSRLTRVRIGYAIGVRAEGVAEQLAMNAKRFSAVSRSPSLEFVKEPLQ